MLIFRISYNLKRLEKGEFFMNFDKVKSEILSKIEKIESEFPLKIIIYVSIFLISLAIVIENKVTITTITSYLDTYEHHLYPLGIFILISLASLLCGSLIGFIFGLPRVISENTSIYSNMYGDNSNLDQISDWLLKILIGVGLAQLNELRNILDAFQGAVENILKSSISGYAAVLLIVIFSVAGFLGSYLLTRRYVALIFMEGLSKQHSIEESMEKNKDDIKKNAEEIVSENRKIIESIQNNQEGFCKWMEKVTKQMNLFEENQRKYCLLNTKNTSLQSMLDCTYPVDGKECLEQIKKLKNEIKNPVEEKVSKKDPLNKDSSNGCSNKEPQSKLQIKMKNNKNEITEHTNKLANENKEIMISVERNQKKFAFWMGVFEDRLKAITDTQIYINSFYMLGISYDVNNTI